MYSKKKPLFEDERQKNQTESRYLVSIVGLKLDVVLLRAVLRHIMHQVSQPESAAYSFRRLSPSYTLSLGIPRNSGLIVLPSLFEQLTQNVCCVNACREGTSYK